MEMLYLCGKVWLRGEVLQARCHVGVTSGLGDGSNQTIGKEWAHTIRAAQAVHVDQLLGCAGEGQASHICWDVVDVGVWYSDGAWVGVKQPLVVRLQSGSTTVMRNTSSLFLRQNQADVCARLMTHVPNAGLVLGAPVQQVAQTIRVKC